MDNNATACVVDNGSGFIKAGLGGENAPGIIFPTIVGCYDQEKAQHAVECILFNWSNRQLTVNAVVNMIHGFTRNDECIFGEEAQNNSRRLYELKYPVESGFVTNWDDMEQLWHHTFHTHLGVDPSERCILMTEKPLNPKKNREKMTEIMFETFKTPGFYVAIDAVLSLYASGRTTGVVLDSGHDVSHTVPIYEGYCLPHATRRLDIAGKHITEYLQRLLMERGSTGDTFCTFEGKEVVRDIKDKVCYIAKDYHAELEVKTAETRKYKLPDGKTIDIGSEQLRAPECIFNPALIGMSQQGLGDLLWTSIRKCDVDIKKDLPTNIVLAGGTTMFDGFHERIQSETESRAYQHMKVKVHAPPERKGFAWLGGSILTSLSTFQEMWIRKEDYANSGASVVHRKCV